VIAGAVILALGAGPPTAHAADAESAFRDKIVRIIVGFPPGGGFDTYSRVIGRHLGRHIPGTPTVIVDNMPGAGSLIAAKHLSRVAKPDGLTFGMLHGNQVMAQIVGRQATDVDFRKFEWLGVPVQDTSVCAFTKASGITSVEAWRGARSPVKLGATTPPDSSYLVARVLQAALGLPIQVVRGYKGTADIRLAAEAGEVAGGCWQWESVKVTWRKALDAGEVLVVLQAGAQPHPDLARVPVANTLATSDEARQLLHVGIEMLSTKTRVYALPPGTPKDRVAILRRAFVETLKDPAFVAEAKRSQLDIDPLSGEAVAETVAGLFQLPPALVGRLKDLVGP
jgi:tripartite-type tricarboxylate transporter receptor subunit TctC